MPKAESLTVHRRELVYKHNLRIRATSPKWPNRSSRKRRRRMVEASRRANRGQRRSQGRT